MTGDADRFLGERTLCPYGALREGAQEVYSMRGHSSHQFNPFLALKRPTRMKNRVKSSDSAWYTAAIFLVKSMWTLTESRECFWDPSGRLFLDVEAG